MRPARHHANRRVALLVVVAAFAMLLAPASALGHASLVATEPADGAVVPTAPDQVQVLFTASVVAGDGAIRVFAPDGSEVQAGAPRPAKGAQLRQAMEASEPGTYGVSYRVSSEDGHVINGSFTFSVGEASSEGGGADASRAAADVPRGLQLAFSISRFVEIVALLAVAGGGLFACIVAPGWQPRLLVVALVSLLLAYAAGFVLTSAILQGSLGAGLDGAAIDATAQTPYGRSTMLRAVVALVALGPVLLLRSGLRLTGGARYAIAVVFVGLAASLSITGHAVTTEPTWLRMPLDMVHVTAAAIWLGGLLQLAFLAPFAATYVPAITRFSQLAFASVMTLLATGAYATYAELGTTVADLLESTYGRLILAKLALYLGTMPLAWNNMSAFVPAVRRRPEDAPHMLRQYVWRELVLVVVVIALTVWLIATPQPK